MVGDRGHFTAFWAFHINEVGIGALHQECLVFPLLHFWRGTKVIFARGMVCAEVITARMLLQAV